MANTYSREISAKKIIKSSSMIKRFHYIFEPLLNRAKENYRELSSSISAIQEKYGSDLIKNYYSFGVTNATSIESSFKSLTNNLNSLEKSWDDMKRSDSVWYYNPTKAGRPEYEHPDKNPLHVIVKENWGYTPYHASGKVRPYDFIAAYNFKCFIESFYAIAAEMRNIAFRVFVNGRQQSTRPSGNVDLFEWSVGKTNKKASFSDITNINRTNYITDISIYPQIIKDSAIFSFNDYIINNNTNGGQIFTYDELSSRPIIETEVSDSIEHGYVDVNSLIPDRISATMKKSVYTNTNFYTELSVKKETTQDTVVSYFGHQSVDHFQNNGLLPTSLSSYYNYPYRLVTNSAVSPENFDFTSQPSSGIAKEYLELKPPTNFNPYASTPSAMLSQWREISTQINSFFVPKTSDIGNIVSKTVVKPGTNYKKQKITASKVNEMFESFNKAAALISSMLCGEYSIQIETGPVDEDPPPCVGLGYPEFFSWYFGGAKSTNIYLAPGLGTPDKVADSEYGSNIYQYYPGEMRSRVGNLGNANQIASEDYERNNVVRAGMCYYKSNRTTAASTEQEKTDLENFKSMSYAAHYPFVPMTLNKWGINQNSDITSYAGVNISSLVPSTTFKFDMLTNNGNSIPGPGVVQFIPEINNNPTKQIFNRYCISHPLYMGAYDEDLTKDLPSKNVNTKYIFMPYMLWLNRIANSGFSIYNGLVRNYRDISSTSYITSYITSTSRYINNAGGIPVMYDDRDDLWSRTEIIEGPNEPTSDEHYTGIGSRTSKLGTVQLQLYTKDNAGSITESPIATNDVRPKLDWFKYFIKIGATVNEVNHTHDGKAITDIGVGNLSRSITMDYAWHSNEGWVEGPLTLTGSNSNISSVVYRGVNLYSNPNGETSCYISDSGGDMMNILFGKRFKFNDFYLDYHPLATQAQLQKIDIAPYFAPGGSNEFVQGNTTEVISWITDISTSVSSLPTFSISHHFNHEDFEKKNSGEKAKSNTLIQGNFFFSGNKSTKVNTELGLYDYRFIPQPSPITATRINIVPSTFTSGGVTTDIGHFSMRGHCYKLWNDIQNIMIYLKHGSNIATYTLKNSTSSTQGSTRPYINRIPPKNGSKLNLNGSSSSPTNGYVKYNTETTPQVKDWFDISVELDIPITDLGYSSSTTELSGDISCAMRFVNENGGFRDVCKSKYNVAFGNGAFVIGQSQIAKQTLP